MKRRLVVVMVALLFAAMQVSSLGVIMSADAYPAITGGTIECDTTLQMIPMTHTVGGGTIHWHITGDNARDLRMLILDRLDNATINYDGRPLMPNDTASGRAIGEIDEAEVWAYVAADDSSFLQNYLQGLHKMLVGSDGYFKPLRNDTYDPIMFHGIEITRASLSNHNMYSDIYGLLGQTADSNADIDIFMTISMRDTVKVDEIDLSNSDVFSAPFECLTAFDDNGNVIDPVTYNGDGDMNHWTITIGFDSFYNPSVSKNSITIIRTPAGELYNYRASIQNGADIEETMQHSEFSPLENPQILFIIMLVFGYLVVALPTHFYLKYRGRYPKRYRMEAKKIKWLHWTARILLLIIILVYFIPVIGSFYFSGPIFMGLSIGFVALSAVLSKVIYERAGDAIPPEYFEEKGKKKKPVKKAAPLAAAPVVATYEPDTKEKIHCIRCGALITIEAGDNLLKVKCPVCGAVQKRVERGYNHLILDSSLKNTYNMLADFLRDGDTALCLTTSMPGKMKRTYHLTGKVKCIWLTSAGGKDTLDPGNIKKIAATIERFAEKYPASIVLIDGIEYLVVEHGFDEVSRMLKKVTDVASMRDITLMVPVNPSSLTGEELNTLRATFDRVEALEDIDEREFF